MLRLLWGLPQLITLVFGLLIIDGCVDAEEKSAIDSRISMTSLNGNPALTAEITAITNDTCEVTIDKIAAEAYLISVGDAQRDFIDKHLVTIADETAAPLTPSPPTSVQKPANIEVKEIAKKSGVSAPPAASSAPITNAPAQAVPFPVTKAPAPAAEPAVPKAATAKPQSILQMIEGHEREFKIGVLIAAGSFALGWICGGSYYVRRERKRRGKLRF